MRYTRNKYVRNDYEEEAEEARRLIKFWCLYDFSTQFRWLVGGANLKFSNWVCGWFVGWCLSKYYKVYEHYIAMHEYNVCELFCGTCFEFYLRQKYQQLS